MGLWIRYLEEEKQNMQQHKGEKKNFVLIGAAFEVFMN